MGRVTKWRGVRGTAVDKGGMLEIDFTSSGYSDPGFISGPPEKCYPPEGEEERTVKGARLFGLELPTELWKKIEGELQEIVDVHEFDAAGESGRQYDPEA